MRLGLPVMSSLMLSACAVPTTGVVPRGDNLYTVTRRGEGFWVMTDQLKIAATLEAQVTCERDNKKLKVIHTKEIQDGAFGRWPESEVLFWCD